MSIKRYNGSGFAEVSGRKRWNGSAWVDLTFGRRWNGSAWIDLWNDGSGSDDSDGSSSEGDLFSKLSSTVSSPTVNYSAAYTAVRTSASTKTVNVTLTFNAWLNSSASRLGTGVKLTVYARMSSGQWHPVVIKNTSDVWTGTSVHSASITLTEDIPWESAKIDFYVTRSGSTYSGTAGNLGSAASPKSYTAAMPTYSGAGSGTVQ